MGEPIRSLYGFTEKEKGERGGEKENLFFFLLCWAKRKGRGRKEKRLDRRFVLSAAGQWIQKKGKKKEKGKGRGRRGSTGIFVRLGACAPLAGKKKGGRKERKRRNVIALSFVSHFWPGSLTRRGREKKKGGGEREKGGCFELHPSPWITRLEEEEKKKGGREKGGGRGGDNSVAVLCWFSLTRTRRKKKEKGKRRGKKKEGRGLNNFS